MTKKQATKDFRDLVLPAIVRAEKKIAGEVGAKDWPFRRLSWAIYVDGLHKEGLITAYRAATWQTPSFLRG
jgi:hypothetical protein